MNPTPADPVPIAWSPSGDWLAYAALPAVVTIARVAPTGGATEQVGHLTMREPVQSLSVSRDGLWLAAGHPDGRLSLYAVDLDARGGWREVARGVVPIQPWWDHDAHTQVAFSPVEDTLAVACGRLVTWVRLDVVALALERDAREPAPSVVEPSAVDPTTVEQNAPTPILVRLRRTDPRQWALSIVPAEGKPTHGLWEFKQAVPEVDEVRSALELNSIEPVPGSSQWPQTTADRFVRMRDALLPAYLQASSPLAQDRAPVALDLDKELEGYPWELLLRGDRDGPWTVTRGLVRWDQETRWSAPPRNGRAVVLVIGDAQGRGGESASMIADEADGWLRDTLGVEVERFEYPWPERLLTSSRSKGVVALCVLGPFGSDVQIHSGDDGLSSQLLAEIVDSDNGTLPSLVLLATPGSAVAAQRWVDHGVRLCIGLDWHVDPEGAWHYLSEFFRTTAAGRPLVECARLASQYAYSRVPGSSAWGAFRVLGDPMAVLRTGDDAKERPMVVVSYVRTYEALARSLVAELQATGRVDARYDGHLSSGQRFPDTVLDWIDQSNALVVLIGPASAQANYSKGELDRAQKLMKPVVPVVVEAGTLPPGLASYQGVNVDDDGSPLLLTHLNGHRLEAALRRVAIQIVEAVTAARGSHVQRSGEVAEVKPVAALAKRLDARSVHGLIALDRAAWPTDPTPLAQWPETSGPSLVLVHGILSSGAASFGALWSQHPQLVSRLFDEYGGSVFAFEHATLGSDPLDAAIELARLLPYDKPIRLLTHSSGGLVAELLVRAALGEPPPYELAEAPLRLRARISELTMLARSRRYLIERIVRVGAPMRGTLLASKRLDAYLSVLKWAMRLGAVPLALGTDSLVSAVANARTDPTGLPGVSALDPESPLIRWVNWNHQAAPGELFVIAGACKGDSLTSRLQTLVSDAYFLTDNDLVVQTGSMYGGLPRVGGARFLLDQGSRVSHFNYFRNERTARAIVDALVVPEPSGFAPIGPLSWAGDSSTGAR